MKLIKENGIKRLFKAFTKTISKDRINVGFRIKTITYRFKNSYRIEVLSQYENNEIFFNPYKR